MKSSGNISSKYSTYLVLLFVGLTLGCLAPASQPPSGNTQSECKQYAKNAVVQNQQNMELACGFTGPAWSANYSHHYDWCMKVPRKQADDGTSQRADALTNQCAGAQPSQQPPGGGSSSGPEVRCDQYAKKAVEQNNENISKGCGFSGPEWSSDYTTHFNWCVNKPKEDADFSASYRENGLKSYCP